MNEFLRAASVGALVGLLSACSSYLDRALPAELRGGSPGLKPFGTTMKILPGEAPSNQGQVAGSWLVRHTQKEVQLETGREPQLTSEIQLELQRGGRYELHYTSYWGPTRAMNDPRFNGIEVEEKGTFALSRDILLLEPTDTQFTRTSKGVRAATERTDNERRAYMVRVDSGYLNFAGRCAKYQVEPVCKESTNVWYSYRYGVGPTVRP